MSLAATSTYPSQSITTPKTAFKIGSFTLNGNSTESVNVNTFNLSLAVADTDTTGNLTVANDITNVYLVYGNTTSSIKATVATSGNTWSPSFVLPVNGSMTVEVYASLSSDFTATDTVLSSLLVSGTTAGSGQAVSTNSGSVLAGQTLTVAAGTVTASLDASTPASQLVDDSGTVTTLAAKIAAVTDSYTVTDATVTVATCSAVSMVELLEGSTPLQSKACATSLTFSGLNVAVAANTNKVLSVRLTMSPIGVGAGTTDSSLATVLTGFTARNSNGTSAAGTGSATGTAVYAYKAVPLLTQVALPNSSLAGGTMAIAKFTVSSNGTGTIAWKQIELEISKPLAPTIASPTLWNSDTGEQITAAAAFQAGTPGVATTCVADNTYCELLLTVGTLADDDTVQSINGAKTYEVRATIGGTLASGNFVSSTLDRNTVAHGASAAYVTNDNSGTGTTTFTWSDESASATSDTGVLTWQKDYLVKNLPLSWTLNRN
jgi:hypothetical protein